MKGYEGAASLRGWLLLCFALVSAQVIGAEERTEWRFEVQLDESPIGYHNFRISRNGAVTSVASEAEFKVRFLMFTAYRYDHEYREVWEGNCLSNLRARTDDNGTAYAVNGGRNDAGFDISSRQNRQTLRSCVMSFAYWNPAILNQDALINAQTGEFVPVLVKAAGEHPVTVGGEQVMASRYDLTAGEKRISVWYGTSGEWLGLESEVDGGRILRYVLNEWPSGNSTWANVPAGSIQEES